MSLRLFQGPAGSGKTTGLVRELASTLSQRPLEAHERVLALTRMHGSRRRLQERLSTVPTLQRQFECITFDSFAWRITRRWRSLCNAKFGGEPEVDDYSEVCRRAGVLLNEPLVSNWIARTFPIVVIDEMQDNKGGQLAMIIGLSYACVCLAAADHFQDLDGDATNPAVTWARENGETITLTQIYRTRMVGLLNAASALRQGLAIPRNDNGFTVLGALNHNVGASFVSRNLTWWKKCNDIAIITPACAETSLFVQNLIARVQEGPIGEKGYGPHQVLWEVSQQDEKAAFIARLHLPDDPSSIVHASNIVLPDGTAVATAVEAWIGRQRRVAGKTTFSVAELIHQIDRIHQRVQSYRMVRSQGVRAMTIHQAKNREFDSVIVLWPYEVKGSPERKRRLLYNAITRARTRVLIVVQNPNRLRKPPFAP